MLLNLFFGFNIFFLRIQTRFLQNFSFVRATAEKCMFRSPQGEKLHSLGKTNPNRRFAVLQEAQTLNKKSLFLA